MNTRLVESVLFNSVSRLIFLFNNECGTNLIINQAALGDRPVGQETTDWFLERGGGLPMDFATAYSVFMRGLGIPARMVKGYALGEPHPTADQRSVQVRHMQFWVEVYVPMAGPNPGEWIQVIPTPLPDD